MATLNDVKFQVLARELGTTAGTVNDLEKAFWQEALSSTGAIAVDAVYANVYDNGSSGTFDYDNGELQKCTLTSPGTVISFANSPEGGMLTAIITDADSQAPDVSGLTVWLNGTVVTYDKVTTIMAANENGTVRYIAAGTYAS